MKSKKYSKKILRYLINGRPNRVKRYVKKKKISLNDFIFKDGDTLLHKISFYGHISIIKHYAKDKLLLMKPNSSNGKLPCHQAVLGAMHRIKDSEDHISSFRTIDFLQQAIPTSFQKQDYLGVSADCLFKVYQTQIKKSKQLHKKLIKQKNKEDDNDIYDSTSDEGNIGNMSEEERWNVKLQKEFHYEMETNEDCYLNSFSDNQEPDNCDKWREEISKEYYTKHSTFSNPHYSSKARSRKTSFKNTQGSSSHHSYAQISADRIDTFNQQLHTKIKEEIEMSSKTARNKYEITCDKFFSNIKLSDTVVSHGEIPWPFPAGGCVEDVQKFLMRDLKSGDMQAFARKNQVRWHPDRFMQRCAGKIRKEDEDLVMDTVKQLSQLFNGILKDCDIT